MVFRDKNSDLYCDDNKLKKKWFLMIEKLDLFSLLKKNEKDFFEKEFHSQYEFMQSWIKTNTNIVVHDLFLYFNNLHVLKKSDLYLKKDTYKSVLI